MSSLERLRIFLPAKGGSTALPRAILRRKLAGIYGIRSRRSGRLYVGSSGHIQKRWGQHRTSLRAGSGSLLLQRVFNKRGLADLEFFLIERVPNATRALLLEREQFWIDELRPAYNVSDKAIGVDFTPEVRAKLSKNCAFRRPEVSAKWTGDLNHMKRPEYREMVSRRMRAMGDNHPMRRPEIVALYRRPLPAEARAKISLALKGRKRTAEHCAALSAAAKRQFSTPEGRDKASKSLLGHVVSKATRAKISAKLKGRPRGW